MPLEVEASDVGCRLCMFIHLYLHPYYWTTFQYCPEDFFKAAAADVQRVIDAVGKIAR
jgi:hypothetical protein